MVRSLFTDDDVYEYSSSNDEQRIVRVAQALSDKTVRVKRLTLVLDSGMTQSSAMSLRDALKVNTSLVKLEIRACRAFLSLILEGVAENATVKELELHHCDVTANDARDLLEALRDCVSLRRLSIEYNKELGDAGASVFANALLLSRFRWLISLGLIDCGITKTGALELAKALKTNTTLREFNPSWNAIGDEGVSAIVHANQSLNKLVLRGVKLGDSGAAALGTLFRRSNCIQELDIDFNHRLTTQGRRAIVEGLGCNTSLLHLDAESFRPFQDNVAYSIGINQFRKRYLAQYHTDISPALWSHVFGRVSGKPSALYLFLQENRGMFIPHLPESSLGESVTRKRKLAP
jgi:hypothetical protein